MRMFSPRASWRNWAWRKSLATTTRPPTRKPKMKGTRTGNLTTWTLTATRRNLKELTVIKILVVDDALADRALVSGLIGKRIDSAILEAGDGRQALAVIETHHPDIVLTDLHMPEMN